MTYHHTLTNYNSLRDELWYKIMLSFFFFFFFFFAFAQCILKTFNQRLITVRDG